MATYVYRTLAGNMKGTLDAPDRAAAVRELVRRGETPASVEPLHVATNGSVGVPSAALPFRSRGFSTAERASLIRELATALTAGLPLVQGLRTLARQGRVGRQREILESMIAFVEGGKSLADAMEAQGKVFSELTINMTRAGEVSGRLGEVLTQAADLMDKDLKLRRAILTATIYPLFLTVLLSIAVIVIVTVIVPKILATLQSQGGHLPLPTQIVQGFAQLLVATWWWVVPLIAGLVLMFLRWYETREGRLWVDTRLLRVPVLGRLLRDVAVARFTRTLGTLSTAGIPILTALRVTKGTLGNRAMENVIDDVASQIAAGKPIAEPMERSGYFPSMLVQIVGLGERSGRLDEMLRQAAGAFEDRVDMSVKLFTAILPPVLILFFAGIVGFVVMSIMLALLEVQNAAGAG